ncbi:nitroreductase/quinone reductase family protein [Pseudonocardia sp. CA-107938]|uniref:nitroreductase/quinone reductase family protein n=1 Tax=Pseudonocardia sp. CA-107938 TaxID=3240021 RepID=UPI003D8B8F88
MTLPPRWVITAIWRLHRALVRAGRGRWGLARPTAGGRFGMLRLRTTGRHSGLERAVVLGYVEDGDDLVTLAMNGWSAPDPAWWLNLRSMPDAEVDLPAAVRRVRAREAHGAERERLWELVRGYDGYGRDLDAMAALRGRETAVVVLEPRD